MNERRARFALLLALLFAAWTRAVAAQELPLELDWQAPSGCPSADDIRTELRRLARPRPGRALVPLKAHGEIAERARSFVLQLTTEVAGERGSTVLESERCADLQRGATLVLALIFGDTVELSEADDGPVRPVAASPSPVASHSAPEPHTAPAPRAHPDAVVLPAAGRHTLLLEAGATLEHGVLPAWALGPRVGVALARRQLLVQLVASATFARDVQLNDTVRARFWSAGTLLETCYRSTANWSFGGCAGASFAVVHGVGIGARNNRSALAPWYGLSATLLVSHRASSSLQWLLRAGAELALDAPEFEVEGVEPGIEPQRFVPVLSLSALLN